MKKLTDLLWRILVLYLAFYILFTLASALAAPPGVRDLLTPEQAQRAATMQLLVSALMSGILIYLVLRSRWQGWKLVGAIALVFYGIHTFMSQIETAAFPAVAERLPPGMLRGLFLADIPFAFIFALLAVWVLRRMRPEVDAPPQDDRLRMPVRAWLWKLAAVAVLYVIVYFTFGYYVAWRTPGVAEYYGGRDLGFLPGFAVTMRETPWLPFFQVFRSVLWAGLAVIIIRMHRGDRLETSFAVGLAFSILMAAPLLLPNPIMGDVVAGAHLREVSTSNLLFGFLSSLILLSRRA